MLVAKKPNLQNVPQRMKRSSSKNPCSRQVSQIK